MRHYISILFMVILLVGCEGTKKDNGGDKTWDGIITRADAPFGSGRTADYVVTRDVISNTAGTAGEGDEKLWDYSGTLAGDHNLAVESLAVEGQWFAGSFTGQLTL